MNPTRHLLVVRELRKIYRGDVVANDGISLEVAAGEVYGLLGPNGAGKTTLVNQCIGRLVPTSGSIHLDGIDLVAEPDRARRLCSYLPQAKVPIDAFTLRQAVDTVGRIRGGSKSEVRRRRDELIQALDLVDWEDTLGTRLSGGVRRLAGFMMAAVRPGRLLILDEPTNDVDPQRRRLLWRQIRRVAAGGTAHVLVTHNVLEAERAVDRLAIIDDGRLRAEGTPTSLKAAYRGQLRLHLTLEPGAASPSPPEWAIAVTRQGRRQHLSLAESRVPAAIEWARGLIGRGLAEEYEIAPPTLEDAYIELLGTASFDAAAA